MSDTSLFLSTRPAYPWSVYPLGLPALGVVALLLVLLTLWTYLGHPAATRRRVVTVMLLRLGALAVVLLTALRPSVGFQEEPKVPSLLLVGVDTSESMTMKDEVNNQSRAEAVRRALDRAKPLLDELAADQNVKVELYAFSTSDFSPNTSRYEADTPSLGKRSDYGTYLGKTFDHPHQERFIRAHLLIGDGADNGTASAAAEAARWGRRSPPTRLTTFTVGSDTTTGTARDLSIAGLSLDPSPAPVKTEVTVNARVHAYGFAGTKVRARVLFDDKEVAAEDVSLPKERDNEVKLVVKAPEKHGEVKVRVEVGREVDGKIEPLPGEVSGLNNQSETYLTVTKEGVRVLVIDQYRPENARLLDALRSEKRFDVVAVWRQAPFPASPEDRTLLDLEAQGYDVVIVGNVSYELLASADPKLPGQLIERVTKKGAGLLFLGGEVAFTGYPAAPGGDPGTREWAFGDLLPVVPSPGNIIDSATKDGKTLRSYQTVPTAKGLDDSVLTLDRDPAKSRELWDQLNGSNRPRSRISGLVRMAKKPGATLYAWATSDDAAVPAGSLHVEKGKEKGDALLVGHQIGEGAKGRVLAFGGYDSYLWERLGQPKTRQGTELHHRFWRQCVLWLAHQEEEEGQVYARPEFRRLAVAGDQTIRVGVKSALGGEEPNPEVEVKVLPPGATDEEKAPRQTLLRDAKGAKVLFRPPLPGEYTVVVTAPLKDKDGNVVPGQKLRGTARFLAYPEVSDEMLNVAADHRFLERLASAGGGKALRLEDLSAYLRELKAAPSDILKPKPRYYPDWRRNHSKGFLPAWLVLFVALLGVEWGLRRYWGMV